MYEVSLLVRLKVSNDEFNEEVIGKAVLNNVVGFVMSLGIGAYYIEAQGEKESINNFVDWCNNNRFDAYTSEYKLKMKKQPKFKEFGLV
jgi:acylphosphatase